MSSKKCKAVLPAVWIALLCFWMPSALPVRSADRPRDRGIVIGILDPGRWNAITDVPGVLVGHCTLIEGDSVRTGVTAVLPHSGDLFRNRVPGAVFTANGFGKLAGSTQVEELGEIETPVVLTNTLSVAAAMEGVIRHTLLQEENRDVRSVNALVGETNDGYLNSIRSMRVSPGHVLEAIGNARSGPVEEGCVGGGTGTVCFGFKGGIGTASRKLPEALGGWTVGVLVQTNFGGILEINGAPVGRELGKHYLQNVQRDGSCMIVVATDAPLLSRNLKRLAARAVYGITRCGGFSSNGSGDYAIAFSTHPRAGLRNGSPDRILELNEVKNDAMTPLFLAAVEATEEAIVNSLFAARTTDGKEGRRIERIPVERVLEICKRYDVLNWNERFPERQDGR